MSHVSTARLLDLLGDIAKGKPTADALRELIELLLRANLNHKD